MSFKDVQGQEGPIGRLQEYIRHKRLGNAYLFIGPDGIGKRMAAWQLAKSLNCENQIWDSCDKCTSCSKIDKAQHPDIHLIGTGDDDWLKIEDIRQLQRDIFLKPYEAKRKVFIIDSAHKLTAEASHALLKVLEEPPLHSLFILISAKPVLLFKTIVSRCQVLKFYSLPRRRLEDILQKHYSLSVDSAHFLAYFCEGRLGEALRLKDVDILIRKNRAIDEFIASGRADLSVNSAHNAAKNLRLQLNLLATWFRDIYLLKTGSAHSEVINFDRKADLLQAMPRFSFGDLDQILDSISEALFYLERNINVKLLRAHLKAQIWKG